MSNKTTIQTLLDVWDQLRAVGHCTTPAELCRSCPELIPELESRITKLERIDAMIGTGARTSGAGTLDVPSPWEIYDQLDRRYLLLHPRGRGGSGEVWRAWDADFCREVAVKISHKPRSVALQEEAKRLAKLTHPHIVSVYDDGECRGRFYVVYEWIDGHSLAEQMQRPRSVQESVNIILRVLDALQYAHTHDVVHGDIKPSNVMLKSHSGQVVLVDFHSAGKRNDDTCASDLYHVALLGELLLGGPLSGQSNQVTGDSATHPETRGFQKGCIPGPICKVLRRALNDDPKECYRDAAHMARALRAACRRARYVRLGVRIILACMLIVVPVLVLIYWHMNVEVPASNSEGPFTGLAAEEKRQSLQVMAVLRDLNAALDGLHSRSPASSAFPVDIKQRLLAIYPSELNPADWEEYQRSVARLRVEVPDCQFWKWPQ
jgi:hypothetical protein